MLPKEHEDETCPVIIFIHGGGWRNGDKASGVFRDYPLKYASRGYVCASVNYRLIDEGTILDCIADCKCAVRWLLLMQKSCRLMLTTLGRMGIRPVLIWWRCLVSHQHKTNWKVMGPIVIIRVLCRLFAVLQRRRTFVYGRRSAEWWWPCCSTLW